MENRDKQSGITEGQANFGLLLAIASIFPSTRKIIGWCIFLWYAIPAAVILFFICFAAYYSVTETHQGLLSLIVDSITGYHK